MVFTNLLKSVTHVIPHAALVWVFLPIAPHVTQPSDTSKAISVCVETVTFKTVEYAPPAIPHVLLVI